MHNKQANLSKVLGKKTDMQDRDPLCHPLGVALLPAFRHDRLTRGSHIMQATDLATVPLPLPPQSLVEQTAGRLRAMITSGEIGPGSRLSEARLATEFDISRNTLREGFRLLTREGLLRHEPNRGVFVETPTMATILDIYRVRRTIEVPAIAQSWPRHAAVERMRRAVETAEHMALRPDWRAVGSANMEFHAAIVALTDSPRLMAFYARVATELRLAFGVLDSPEMLHAPYIALNREIVALVEAGEAQRAAEKLDAYLLKSERTILEAFARLG